MKTIPQRTLRNESGEVLRRAEAGERFVVTVHGRPVAVLGPYERRQWVPTAAVRDLLRTPTDPTLLDDLREMDADADLADPWLRSAKGAFRGGRVGVARPAQALRIALPIRASTHCRCWGSRSP
jgi:prevent-host-death family protein